MNEELEEVIILFIVSHRFNISIFKVRKYIVYFYNFIISHFALVKMRWWWLNLYIFLNEHFCLPTLLGPARYSRWGRIAMRHTLCYLDDKSNISGVSVLPSYYGRLGRSMGQPNNSYNSGLDRIILSGILNLESWWN